MSRASFPAMGTTFDAVAGSDSGLEPVRRAVEAAERRFSRFLPDSELSKINRSADAALRPSPEMGDVLAIAELARARTDGLVDIGMGGAVLAWGYDRPYDELDHADKVMPQGDLEARWSFDGGVLRRAPGVRLDLGGVVKGWVCDRLVESGAARLLSGGGDLRSAEPSCVVRVRDPWGDDAAVVALGVGALATSSVTRRTWLVEGAPVHHLIDPRTGRPSDSPVLSATVVAETAVDAEIGAKAVLLSGADGLAWASRQPWIRSALVVWHDGSVFGTPRLELAS